MVYKPFHIPRISDMTLKLQGFWQSTVLDLNIGYNMIRLHPDASRICAILLSWGKYS